MSAALGVMRRPLVAISILCLMLLAASCGGTRQAKLDGASQPAAQADAPAQPWAAQLPALDELTAASTGRAVSAATPYELLNTAPVASSTAGATWSVGSLILAPESNGGIAWAVFSLAGFPGPAIYPQSIASDKGGPLWVGLSRYTNGRWDWRKVNANPTAWNKPYGDTTGFVSPSAATFVAVVVLSEESPLAHSLTTLTLTASDALFAAPTADVAVTSPRPTAQYAVTFDLSGSTAGDGNLTTVTFTPDAAGASVSLTPADLLLPQTYTYATPGSKTATLTLVDDLGGSDTAQLVFNVADTFKELLVVYNSDIPESADLASYYMAADTGRGIDPAYQLGLPLGTNETDLPRQLYYDTIRDPIKTFLNDNSPIKNGIKYLLLFKGVPYAINNDGNDSVDSELCLLYSSGIYTASERLWSADSYQAFDNSGFYEGIDRLGSPQDFQPFTFSACNMTAQQFEIAYLVGRISAYTYDEAKLTIDRSLSADTTGTGSVLMDSHPGWDGDCTMTDPVWPFDQFFPPQDVDCLDEILTNAGYSHSLDHTYEVLLKSNLPDQSMADRVIGYTGWGVNHSRNGGTQYPSAQFYILRDLDFTYLPGAAFVVYESFSAQNFNWDGQDATHNGQGQLCDFFRMGGTVGAGNCYEPYTDGVPDERRVIERYILKGDRWIEACYKGMRYYSWHTIVVGDPLCRVKP